MNISFIGYGNIAKAIIKGLAQDKAYSLTAAAPSLAIETHQGLRTHSDNKAIVADADLVILAVKPIKMAEVLEEINPCLPKSCLLISVASGLTCAWFSKFCAKNQALVRAMPNTPASVGLAATPLFANAATQDAQKEQAEQIFSKIGLTYWLDHEEEMDAFTALSGSGPAYVFSFMEAMIHAGMSLGIDQSTSQRFVLQTFKGALALAEQQSIPELRAKVTSAKGTTEAALKLLHQPLEQLVLDAIRAAQERAQELGRTL